VYRAVFLDRDGVINIDSDYPHKPEELELIEGSAEGIKILSDLGFEIAVLSNQSGVGRGLFKEADLEAFTQEIIKRVNEEVQDEVLYRKDFYYCTHHPCDACSCRKPKPGLLWQVAIEKEISTTHSYIIGDNGRDLFVLDGYVDPKARFLISPKARFPTYNYFGQGNLNVRTLYEAAKIIDAMEAEFSYRQESRIGTKCRCSNRYCYIIGESRTCICSMDLT
jgi:D-glycero-D-manno-heptose 1,7-bisphosphate phosphatase